MTVQWFDAKKWREFEEQIPITCVDVLPLRRSNGDRDNVDAMGLIMRETPHQGQRWCLVGGRLCRNESFPEAITREIKDALGNDVCFTVKDSIQPHYVAEYFPFHTEHGAFDPRKHAIGLTFCVPMRGNIHPQGEALSFAWFDFTQIPPPEKFGFNHDRAVTACLARLRLR